MGNPIFNGFDCGAMWCLGWEAPGQDEGRDGKKLGGQGKHGLGGPSAAAAEG